MTSSMIDAPQPTFARRVLQRSFDVVVAGVVVVLMLPIALLAGVAIKLTSPGGPVLLREVRVGRDGERFDLLKLRTTTSANSVVSQVDVSNPDPAREAAAEASGSQRGTAVGRVLRRCSIDDLPQWWNVLRGDMSVIGPPPSAPGKPGQTPDRGRSPGVRPGLTGVWRASGR